jgi:hypothetical protein
MHPILLSSQHSPGIQQRSELPVNANLLYLSLMYVLACTILLQKKLFKMSREAKESKRNYGNKWETSESKKSSMRIVIIIYEKDCPLYHLELPHIIK